MSLEDRFAQHDKEIVDKFINPNADFQMRNWDYIVRPYANGATGAITITLPSVAEAKGRWYSIICREADVANTVTVADKDDSECWLGDIVMDNKCDRLLAYSDGLAWFVVYSGGWPQMATTIPPDATRATDTTAAPTTLAPTTGA